MFVFTISVELFTRSDAKTDAEENDKAQELNVKHRLWGVIKKTENIVLETFLEGWKIEIWLLTFIWSLGDVCHVTEKRNWEATVEQNHSEAKSDERSVQSI